MPPAARITDFHACPMVTPGTPPIPHVGGPIIKGSFNVLTGKLPQARVGDMAVCVGPPDTIVKGSSGVFVNKMPAARIGDSTAHGGTIVAGLPTVIIGESKSISGGGAAVPKGALMLAYSDFVTQLKVLIDAQRTGAPFCEACFKAAQEEAGVLFTNAAPTPSTDFQNTFTIANSTPSVMPSQYSIAPDLFAAISPYLSKSDTLNRKIVELLDDGWDIRRPNDIDAILNMNGTYTHRSTKTIVIDDDVQGIQILRSIAHEIGHASYSPPKPDSRNRKSYVETGTTIQLQNEGEATIVNIEIRNEIIASGGPDIGVSGQNDSRYIEIVQSGVSRTEARALIGEIFRHGETPSGEKHKDYEEKYSSFFSTNWSRNSWLIRLGFQ